MTIGWPVRASAAQSGRSSLAAAKPVARITAPLTPRIVAGMPAEASPPKADVTPDSTRNGMLLRRQRQRLLAAAREDQRMPALQPHHLAAFLRQPDQQRVDLFLRDRQPPAAFSDEEFFRLARHRHDLLRHQRVVHQRVGLGERRQHVERQQPRIAGSRAGQPDMAGLQLRPVMRQPRDRLFEETPAHRFPP